MEYNQKANTIFIVEDEPIYRRLIEYALRLNPDHQVMAFGTGKDCLKNLHLRPSVVVLDYGLPDMRGIDVLRKIKAANSKTQVIVLSAQKDINIAVSLLKEGAYDYINKDESSALELKSRLLNTVHELQNIKDSIPPNAASQNYSGGTTLSKKRINTSNNLLPKNRAESPISHFVKGKSPAIQQVFRLIEKSAKTAITVSITGETGTGKELVAKAIHAHSSRNKQPFVAVNIAAIPKELIESELFGHEKGAFTGAVARRVGKFELAHKGTLFLDEIGEMDHKLQAKLLRVLQEREINRIGSNQDIAINVRIVTATHRHLQDLVQAGKFREDLYYRLLGMPIHLPPLRERGDDILLLAHHFLSDFCNQNNLGRLRISEKAEQKLLGYSYSGNVRELKAVIELAAVMTDHQVIEPADLYFDRLAKNADLNPNNLGKELTLKVYNQRIVSHLLQKYDDNVVLVAKKLDIGKSTIYRMLKEMD